jgi:hypothetical protein
MKRYKTLEMKPLKKGEEINFKWEDQEIVYFLKAGAVKIVSFSTHHKKYSFKKDNAFGGLVILDNENKAIAVKVVARWCGHHAVMKFNTNDFRTLNEEVHQFTSILYAGIH